ncbi:DNA circularization N-terminal domain-containing protein [Treponema primitia]|uniref:DNA circularization N-terminal domain-containing protein n=1 Tax=Treponema primitia TaxID=88058 RepID=UPI00397ECAE2
MPWINRLRDHIELTSPEGTTFRAAWQGNDISVEKRIGRYAYPGVDGETSQDMGLNSFSYPLEFFFTDADHDKTADKFMRTLSESGPWKVIHPQYGLKKLQPISATLASEPIEMANATKISSEWFEPIDDSPSIENPAAEVSAAVRDVNRSSIDEFASVPVADKVKFTDRVKKVVSKIRKVINTVNNAINTVQNIIVAIGNGSRGLVRSLAGAIITLLELPGLFKGSINNQIAAYKKLGEDLQRDFSAAMGATGKDSALPSSSSTASMANTIALNKLMLSTISAGMATTIIAAPVSSPAETTADDDTPADSDTPATSGASTSSSGSLETRAQAMALLRDFNAFLDSSEKALDNAVKKTSGLPIDQQASARTDTREPMLRLRKAMARYLMDITYNLKVEKRITLDRPRSPIEIACTEYKTTAGNFDYYYHLFLRTNNLSGREILLLPAGREVVIYA